MDWLQYVGDVGPLGALVIFIIITLVQKGKPLQIISDLVEKMGEQMQRWVDAQLENAELERLARNEEFKERSLMQLQNTKAALELTRAIMQLKAQTETNTVVIKAHRAESKIALNELGEKIEHEHEQTRQVVEDSYLETRQTFRSYWGENASRGAHD